MLSLLVLLLVPCAWAAPYYPEGPHSGGLYPGGPHSGLERRFPFNEDVFDTRRFWSHLATEMQQLDDMLNDFRSRFPPTLAVQKVEGNEYKITIPLRGFDEKDIVVKAREGLLMVQAVHRVPEGLNTYLDIKTLPSFVNVTGVWVFENNVLQITFPLKSDAAVTPAVEETGEAVTEESAAVSRDHSKEVMESEGEGGGMDADVGLRGDDHTQTELFTNEVPRDRVEATTYAVDLKDEVEFVPVHY